jgi:hypothetical protein
MPSLQDGEACGAGLFPGFHPWLFSLAPSGSELCEERRASSQSNIREKNAKDEAAAHQRPMEEIRLAVIQ